MGVIGDLLGLYGKKKAKPKLFEHTYSGRFLKDISEKGIYSPEVKRKLLSGMGSELGGVASRRKASTRGYLASRGMTSGMGGTSIAAARLLDKPSREVGETLGRQSLRLDTENEMLKLRAGESLASGKTKSRENKRAWRADFWGGVGKTADDVVATGTQAYMGGMAGGPSAIFPSAVMGAEKYGEIDLDRQYQDALNNNDKVTQEQILMLMLIQAQRGGLR
ncbi:hypothetical protein LCGC14_1054390 [marine sediment metagenome]|uniref:Uncharacterized protein n=1 Tax=marine sediment metagenome TaxID=412755 RepID=A0A0F9MSF5_9ZZZZ